MPSQLITNDNVEFICGRNFTFNGKDYKLGEDFPQDEALGRIETLVRTRHVIPVVESYDVKPRHWHREVRIKSEVLDKLGVKQKSESPKKEKPKMGPGDDPSNFGVNEVLEYLLSDHIDQDEYDRVINAEVNGKGRKGILDD